MWPTSPYALSKMMGEIIVSTYRKLKKIKNALSLRLFNVYDPGRSATDQSVISKFARDLLGGQSPTILGDGNQIRDFISVNDAVDSIILATDAFQEQCCVTNGTPFIRSNKMRLHTFNVGTGIPTIINDLEQ